MTKLTTSTKPTSEKDIKREWHCIDAANQILGRTAPRITLLLQGKHKRTYSPNLDGGDYVVVINAEKIKVTGNKVKSKIYTSYSGYPGGLKEIPFERLMAKKPTEIILRAVSGMLPKNKLRDRRMARLYIYAGKEHPYTSKFTNI